MQKLQERRHDMKMIYKNLKFAPQKSGSIQIFGDLFVNNELSCDDMPILVSSFTTENLIYLAEAIYKHLQIKQEYHEYELIE